MIELEKFKPTRISQSRCIFILSIMLSIYLIENIQSFSFNKSSLYIYIVKPLICLVIILILYYLPRMKAVGKILLNSYLKWWVSYLAIIYILLMLGGGLLYGFGKSPYDLSLEGIFRNIFLAFTPLVAKELMRAYLINSIKGKNIARTISIIAILFKRTRAKNML